MKKIILLFTLLLISSSAFSNEVKIKITNVKENQGKIVMSIHGSKESFKKHIPDKTLILQTTNDEILKKINRKHTYQDVKTAIELARKVGFACLDVYEEESMLRRHMTDGDFTLHFGEVRKALVGAGLAYRLGISPRFVPPIEIYFPDRKGKVSLAQPAAALKSVRIHPAGLFSVNADMDGELIILPIETMRELLGYEEEVSGIEIRLAGNPNNRERRRILREIRQDLGEGYRVRDRYSLNETIFKMMRYEKLAIFGILVFIVIIIAFNVYSSLTMLIIEKKDDIGTLRSLGADDRLIRRTFVLEGWLISMVGMVAGLILGIAFALLQQRFGFIKMPGNYLLSAYPVILQWKDILISAAVIAAIGYIIALIPDSRK